MVTVHSKFKKPIQEQKTLNCLGYPCYVPLTGKDLTTDNDLSFLTLKDEPWHRSRGNTLMN